MSIPSNLDEISAIELLELAEEHDDVAELVIEFLNSDSESEREDLKLDILTLCEELTLELDFY